MPATVAEWFDLSVIVLFMIIMCMNSISFFASNSEWWRRWRLPAGGLLIVIFGIVCGLDLWRNQTDRFPSGPFPRSKAFYIVIPLFAAGNLIRGGIDARRKAADESESAP